MTNHALQNSRYFEESMLTEGAKHQLQPVISALQQHLGPKLIAVVLFGSRARQEHSSESDWDLLLIAEGLPSKASPLGRAVINGS